MKILKIIFFVIITQNIVAQKQLSKAQVDSLPNTIENQFTKIYRLSNNWQDYKMIKRSEFVSFQKNILDSVVNLKKDIVTKQLRIENHSKSTNALKEEIKSLKENLSLSIEKEDAISLLGMSLKKGTYNSILWGIISLLLIALSFFIFKFSNSYVVTKEAKDSLTDVENEFEHYKKKSIEKEQKLRRQLQDEINKQRGV